jgi:hypothetical protein
MSSPNLPALQDSTALRFRRRWWRLAAAPRRA